MHERKAIARELDGIEQEMKELEIRYEQYFAGVEKREPLQDRQSLARRLRQFSHRRIIYTDLRFRYQGLATRFHSYSGHWDRILRLMDEGRYVRQTTRKPLSDAPPAEERTASSSENEIDEVYRQLLEARKNGSAAGAVPDRSQVAAFLEKQREKIREKFGEREVVFSVETEGGRPKIKVKARR